MTQYIPLTSHGPDPFWGPSRAAPWLWAGLGGLSVAVLALSAALLVALRHSPAPAPPVPAQPPVRSAPPQAVRPATAGPEAVEAMPMPGPGPVVGSQSAAARVRPGGVSLPPWSPTRDLAVQGEGQAAVSPLLPPSQPQTDLKGVYGTKRVCAECGWVESVELRSQSGLPPEALAAAGAVIGARAAGNPRAGTASVTGTTASAGASGSAGAQSSSGNAAASAVGAVLGARAATGGQDRAQGGPLYAIRIRMEDGSLRNIEQAEPLPLGAAVVMQGGVPHLVQPQQAVQPAGAGKVYGTH